MDNILIDEKFKRSDVIKHTHIFPELDNKKIIQHQLQMLDWVVGIRDVIGISGLRIKFEFRLDKKILYILNPHDIEHTFTVSYFADYEMYKSSIREEKIENLLGKENQND